MLTGRELWIILAILGFAFFFIAIWLLITMRHIKYDHRISNYTVNSLLENDSIFDKLVIWYKGIEKEVSKFLTDIKIFDSYSKHYEKYVNDPKTAMNYISSKLLFGLSLVILYVCINLVLNQNVSSLSILFVFLIGFFIIDVIVYFQNKRKVKKIEEDLLKAISIMSHSFEAGKSIMQAIKVVSEEVDGPLAVEFDKMYNDMTYGLSLETVLKRFSNRIKSNDVTAITTSLIILNTTGGDIVSVFNSIEKSYYTRKKLKQELDALTASSNLIFKIMLVIPVLLFALITWLDNDYFVTFVNNPIGIILLGIIILLYIIYAFIISKIMDVEEY